LLLNQVRPAHEADGAFLPHRGQEREHGGRGGLAESAGQRWGRDEGADGGGREEGAGLGRGCG
jgi:hypothetical protein